MMLPLDGENFNNENRCSGCAIQESNKSDKVSGSLQQISQLGIRGELRFSIIWFCLITEKRRCHRVRMMVSG